MTSMREMSPPRPECRWNVLEDRLEWSRGRDGCWGSRCLHKEGHKQRQSSGNEVQLLVFTFCNMCLGGFIFIFSLF